MPKEDRLKALETTLLSLDKQFGKGTVMKLGDKPQIACDVINTGSLLLDRALGIGGLPKGRIVEVYGPESCLDKDTFIQYELRTLDGKRINHKGGTIEHLYERFHNCCKDNRCNKIDYDNTVFYISSIDSDDRIIKQPIADVKKCGKKECFKISTKSGKEIIATKDHKFYIGNGEYTKLENIKIGQNLYIHDNINSTEKKNEETFYYEEKFVKYYPNGKQKIVNKNLYYREKVSHLVYEANLNGYSYDEFIKILNNIKNKDIIDNFIFIDKTKYDIHHKDLNPNNNNLENLQLIEKSEHYKLHATNNQKYLSFVVIPDEVINIENVGEKETYDIKCYAPYNNYIANNIAVHNCGKTTLTLHIIAEVQKAGGIAGFVDAEHAMDPVYAKNIGVDIDNLYISQPDSGEQGLEIVDAFVRSGAMDIVVVDSVAALTPQKELDGEMGDVTVGLQARLN